MKLEKEEWEGDWGMGQEEREEEEREVCPRDGDVSARRHTAQERGERTIYIHVHCTSRSSNENCSYYLWHGNQNVYICLKGTIIVFETFFFF